MPGRLRRYDEAGHVHFLTISCFRRLRFFNHDPVKQACIDGMVHTRARLSIRWIAYVVMPEHVHLLCYPHPVGEDQPVPISAVLQHFKQYVGRYGKAALREVWRDRHTLGTHALDAWALGDGPKPFWKPRAYNFNVTTEKAFRTRLDYIHKNPITRGLVDRADQWRWSSYRYYELNDQTRIAMDWDGSWPVW